jgi:hypothetical protein
MSDHFALQTTIEVNNLDTDGNGLNDNVETITTSYDENGNVKKMISVDAYFSKTGAPTYRSTTTTLYDSVGNPTSITLEIDEKADGFIDQMRETTFDYPYTVDANGTVLSYVDDTDFSPYDGVIDTRTTYSYNAFGQETSVVSENFNSSGVATFRRTTSNTYNTLGELLSTVSTTDTNADGQIEARTTETFNADGSSLEVNESFDLDNNPDLDNRETITYGTNGYRVAFVDEFFDDAGKLTSRTTNTYDAVGNLTSEKFEFDSNADGAFDPNTETTTTTIAWTYTFFPGTQTIQTASISLDTLLALPFLLFFAPGGDREFDADFDGNPETEAYTYDAFGNILSEVFEEYDPSTRTLLSKTTSTFAYDAFGNEIASTFVEDDNADGITDFQSSTTTTILDNVFVGTRGKDVFTGTVADDFMTGDRGNDTLTGLDGDDELTGGRGVDRMTGGEGADKFIYTNFQEGEGRGDRIQDFDVEDDMIVVNAKSFRIQGKSGEILNERFFVVGSEAENQAQRFVYDDRRGVLFASGGGQEIVLAKMDRGLELTNENFMIL